MADRSFQPARTLNEVIQTLNGDTPLESGDSRYEDLSSARSDISPIKKMERRLSKKQGGTFEKIAFMSHRGAGKSTELQFLRERLKDRYFSIYFEANVEMNAISFDLEDLLLVLARQIDLEMQRIGHPLNSDLIKEVGDWFAEVLKVTSVGTSYRAEVESQIQAGAKLSLFAGLTTKITSLIKQESEHKDSVKQVLRKYPGELIDRVNSLLYEAHKLLKVNLNRELLIVIDNLDRYDPLSIDTLMIRQGDRFSTLNCNFILTPPISLYYKPHSGLLNEYSSPEVLPTLRLRDRQDSYDTLRDPGAALLKKAMDRRLEVDRLIPDVALWRRLLVACGGSIRELILLIKEAALSADGEVIDEPAVTAAVNQLRSEKRTQINTNGWAKTLAEISHYKTTTADLACMNVLHYRLAFQYNGTTWHDIHPLVAELPEIHAQLQLLRNPRP